MRLTSAELESRIKTRCPHALVVEDSLMRRAVREDRGIAQVRTFVPHTHVYALPRATLIASIRAEDEVDAQLREGPGDWVILVPRGDRSFEGQDIDAVLVDTWRCLFHARIDEELGRQVADGRLDRARVLDLIGHGPESPGIGQFPFAEARGVLEDELLMTRAATETRQLMELIALYNELRFFEPSLLGRYFPLLADRQDRADLIALFDSLVPAPALFEETRLEGAPDPVAWTASRRAPRSASPAVDAVDATDPMGRPQPTSQAVATLARRLHGLSPDGDSPKAWTTALEALVPRARWGMARVEARLLHDLERACDDAEKPVWDIDLGRFLRSFGRAPIRRQEVIRQRVASARHVARAERRLIASRLTEAERRRLQRLIGALALTLETQVRADVGALLHRALSDASIVPNQPDDPTRPTQHPRLAERVAAEKVVAELCDKLIDRGFIAFADLRDTLAMNQLKLADLRGPGEWFKGDPLLRLDQRCADTLDSGYRKAEFYRRAFHRLSAALFGTAIGRILVRFLLLPVLGAFIAVEGFDHTVLAVVGWIFGGHPRIASIPVLIATTLFLFALIHSETARRWTVRALRRVGHAFNFIFSELPRRFLALPFVVAILRTRGWRIFREHVWRPTLFALLPTLIAVIVTHDARFWLFVGLPLTAAFSIWFLTRRGARFAEQTRDGVIIAWHHIHHELVPGLIAAVLDLFKRIVDKVEVVLYVVDQWLRYRRGDSTVGLVVKAVFGVVWAVVAYLVRLTVSLVAEPQLNPIKHFPVVTVTHKVTLPASAFVAQELSGSMGPAWGNFIGLGVFQLAVPGIAGFLVWEFKENWRLYAANRNRFLRPVIVGSHGEAMHRLLRPGFHSGTIPTLLRKLRRAERRVRTREIRRLTDALHHVEQSIERFILRELKAPLVLCEQFADADRLGVASVKLSPARIAVTLTMGPDLPDFEFAFEEQARHLVAHVVRPGFVSLLDPTQRTMFDSALTRLYALASVDLLREDIIAALPPGARYDIKPRGLVFWPALARVANDPSKTNTDTAEVVYPLRFDRPFIEPEARAQPQPIVRSIPVAALAFKQRQVPWDRRPTDAV